MAAAAEAAAVEEGEVEEERAVGSLTDAFRLGGVRRGCGTGRFFLLCADGEEVEVEVRSSSSGRGCAVPTAPATGAA